MMSSNSASAISRPAVAVGFSFALLLAGLPPAAADEDQGPAGPTSLALYILADAAPAPQGSTRAFSAFPGDAMPGPHATEMGEVRASTHVLERAVLLEPQEAFRVALDPHPDLPAPARARVEVELNAEDLLGRRILLASGVFDVTSEVAYPVPAPGPVPDPGSTVGPLLNATRGNLARNVVDAAYAACDPRGATGIACNQTTGHFGYGQIRACKAPRTTLAGGLLYDLAWELDTAYRGSGAPDALPTPASSVSPCSGAFDAVNATADLFPPVPSGSPAAASPPMPKAREADPMPARWDDMRLDASAPDLATHDGRIEIPAGYRLVLDAVAVSTTGEGPIALQVGVNERSRLEVRSYTDDLFVDFTQRAERIGLGEHTGAYDTPADVRHYALDVEGGQQLRLIAGAGTRLTLYDPDGLATTGATANTSGAPGRWTVAVSRTSPTQTTFAFAVDEPQTTPSGTLPLADGTTFGDLGPGDDEDAYRFHAWRMQWVKVTLRAPTTGAGDAAIAIDEEDFLPGTYSETALEDGSVVHEGRTRETTTIDLRVLRAWGSFGYAIDLWRDPAGDLALVPQFHTLLASSSGIDLLGGYHGSADVVVGNETLRVSPEGVTILGPGGEGLGTRGAAPHTADGGVIADSAAFGIDLDGRALLRGGAVEKIRQAGGSPSFGPDGLLYFLDHDRDGAPVLVGLRGDRTERNIPFAPLTAAPGFFAFSADGVGHYLRDDGRSFAVDVLTGAVWEESAMPLLRDAEGNGYEIQTWATGTLSTVDRIDVDDGRNTTAAWADGRIDALAVSGTRLYVLLNVDGAPQARRLAYADLGVPMFEGFQPSLTLGPMADLRPTEMTLTSRGMTVGSAGIVEELLITVRIVNEGPGASLPTNVSVIQESDDSSGSFHPPIPALAPGESYVAEIIWRTRPRIGDQPFDVYVDVPSLVTETDEDDNRVEFILPTRVPTYGPCALALETALGPGRTGPCEQAPS